jgi:hypothetical protein
MRIYEDKLTLQVKVAENRVEETTTLKIKKQSDWQHEELYG